MVRKKTKLVRQRVEHMRKGTKASHSCCAIVIENTNNMLEDKSCSFLTSLSPTITSSSLHATQRFKVRSEFKMILQIQQRMKTQRKHQYNYHLVKTYKPNQMALILAIIFNTTTLNSQEYPQITSKNDCSILQLKYIAIYLGTILIAKSGKFFHTIHMHLASIYGKHQKHVVIQRTNQASK